MENWKELLRAVWIDKSTLHMFLFLSAGIALVICFKILKDYRYNPQKKAALITTLIITGLAICWILLRIYGDTSFMDPFWEIIALLFPTGLLAGYIMYKLVFNKRARRLKKYLIRMYRKRILKLPY